MKTIVRLWLPATFFVGAAGIIAILSIASHFVGETSFAIAYGAVLSMLAPLAAFFVIRAIEIERKVSKLGGWWSLFISTVTCTSIVIVINVLANLTRMFTYNVQPWEIYGFYLVIAVAEEVYYRVFLCLGTIIMLSCKNRIAGIAGTIAVAVMAAGASLSPVIEFKIGLYALSVLPFLAVAIVFKHGERGPAIVPSIIAVIISAVMFSLAHFNVYAAYPEMLVATLLAGGVMAIYLVITRNPFVPIVAHFANNLASMRGIIIN